MAVTVVTGAKLGFSSDYLLFVNMVLITFAKQTRTGPATCNFHRPHRMGYPMMIITILILNSVNITVRQKEVFGCLPNGGRLAGSFCFATIFQFRDVTVVCQHGFDYFCKTNPNGAGYLQLSPAPRD